MATKGLTDLPPSRRPYLVDPPVIAPGHSFASVTEKVMRTVLTPHTPIGWIFGVLMAFGIVQILMMAAGYLFWKGVGIWVGLASGLAAVGVLMVARWMMRDRLGLTRLQSA